jgi:Transposase DDE domain group 1
LFFTHDRGECENRIEEFKNGFRADRLSCHRFLANAFRLLLHAAAYNLVNLFRLQLPQPWRSAQIETLRARLFNNRRPHPPDRPLYPHPSGHRLALAGLVSIRRARHQQQLIQSLCLPTSSSRPAVIAEP